MQDHSIDVFDYLDYRAFLRDFYETKKADNPAFSYRAFSRRAGVGAPNYLKLVVDAQRNLGSKLAGQFASACGLKGDGHRYFTELVAFNQSDQPRERRQRRAQLIALQHAHRARLLERQAAPAFFKHWYVPAIRELAACAGFRADATWIAAQLTPSISPAQAQHALDTLVSLGLLVRNARTGRLEQSSRLLETNAPAFDHDAEPYIRTTMQRALHALDHVPSDQRHHSFVTLSLSSRGLRRLEKRIAEFRKELAELSSLDADPEQVIQVNFQIFPLSEASFVPSEA